MTADRGSALLPIVLLPSNPPVGAVLLAFEQRAFADRDLAVGLGAVFDVVDVLLVRFQARFFAAVELTARDALVDAGVLALLALVCARGLVSGERDRARQQQRQREDELLFPRSESPQVPQLIDEVIDLLRLR